MTAGMSALVFALMLGKRVGYPAKKAPPHNLTMTLIGAGLLWFGWFGFNAGSALTSGGLASLALVNTHIAAAMGALSWASVEWIRHGKPSSLGVASGLVAGLVVVTPAAGFISPASAVVLGLLAGAVCFGGVLLKGRFGYDDTLDAFGVHGVGGTLGAILTGVFAAKAMNPAGSDGLLAGDTHLFVEQLIGAGATAVYSVVMTFILLKVLDRTMGLRVAKDVEQEGLDVVLHGEEGYALTERAGTQAAAEGNKASKEAAEGRSAELALG
jgi:Amt family ammonium transporter